MHKKKISKRQGFSLKNMAETRIKSFRDSQKVGAALLECLIENDTESFIEILDTYLRVQAYD